MSNFQDLTGQRFGELTVLHRAENSLSRGTRWLCQCDCGRETVVFAGNLTRGNTTSCGCTRLAKTSQKLRTHGETKTRLYQIWYNMVTRCHNTNDPHFQHYGARGIVVCEEWRKYENFRDWALSHGYTDSLTIERSDVNGNYHPDNCTWASRKQQANNKRTSRYVEFDGERRTVAEWAEHLGMDSRALWDRLFVQNWSVERALTTPLRIRPKKKKENSK